VWFQPELVLFLESERIVDLTRGRHLGVFGPRFPGAGWTFDN
jgi:hypothetical protein